MSALGDHQWGRCPNWKVAFRIDVRKSKKLSCNAVLRAARAVNSAVILSASLIVLIDRRMMYFEPPHGLFLGSLFFYLATLMYRILMAREARANAHRRSDAKKWSRTKNYAHYWKLRNFCPDDTEATFTEDWFKRIRVNSRIIAV